MSHPPTDVVEHTRERRAHGRVLALEVADAMRSDTVRWLENACLDQLRRLVTFVASDFRHCRFQRSAKYLGMLIGPGACRQLEGTT